MESNMNCDGWWWGYLHREGTVHTKRYFSREDIIEAQDSPFVDATFGPWPCNTKEEAEKKLREEINERNKGG
jgi:hypothetical protein